MSCGLGMVNTEQAQQQFNKAGEIMHLGLTTTTAIYSYSCLFGKIHNSLPTWISSTVQEEKSIKKGIGKPAISWEKCQRH